jgi:hypothetical protein
MQTGLKTCSVWVETTMVPIENRFNSVVNITSFFSLDIPKWKS